jgi:hypothetical protein
VLAYHHILRVRQPGRRRPQTESGGDQGAALVSEVLVYTDFR